MSTPRKTFRSLLAGSDYTIAAGAYDGLSARLVQAAGFKAVYMTGGGFSRANGYPDIGLLTLTEIAGWLARVSDVVNIPVIADADSGYGNALNVVRAVREFERAGVSAFHLEDQVSPKKCGHYEGKKLISQPEMIGKIKAACDARRDQDLVIIARSDARAMHGLDAAIDRVNSYLEAGADVGFVEAPQSEEELAEIARRSVKPSLCNIFEGGKTPPVPAAKLQKMGFRVGIYPSQTQRAAIRAMTAVLDALKRDGDTAAIESQLATFAEREVTVDSPCWKALEDRYLRSVVEE